MKVLVTGGSGMMGRNLLDALATTEHQVLAPRRVELDLLDWSATKKYLAQEKPDCIVHCAGRVGGIQANIAAPAAFLAENASMGINLVTAAMEGEVPRLLSLGSSCMYPKDSPDLLREDMVLAGPLEPTNEGYALAKIAVARLCEYATAQHPQRPYKTLIPCNLYGRYDHFEPSKAHLIPAAIAKVHQAKANSAAVEIWGDGEARREFMAAADMANFIVLAMQRYDELPPLMNVGLGHDYSVNEYYQCIAEVLEAQVTFRHDLDKPVGMRRKLLDVSLAKDFGWSAPTSLAQGIKRAYQFFLEREAGK